MLNVQNIRKQFNRRTIIDRLSFQISQGEKICIFAPSGAGKTTLIRILSGLDTQFQGNFIFQTQSIASVFQDPGLFWYKTVEENIFYPFKISGATINSKTQALLSEWMEISGLKGFEKYYPHEISGGMKQKVSLVRAFITRPEFIMMDEPFKSIDVVSKQRIIKYMRQKYHETSWLLVTHNLDEIPLASDRVLLFKQPTLSDYQVIQAGQNGGLHAFLEAAFNEIT